MIRCFEGRVLLAEERLPANKPNPTLAVTPIEVFKNFLRFIIKNSGRLKILRYFHFLAPEFKSVNYSKRELT
jgi:hypothetical protein